eukprot:TRINITY_DN6395_c0_g3_i2.p1 TRINITY_DN6395_c0_g3~~TRINITY_DN6395_c0_g3_i2.p1  ORF type:complete len:295 (-),score=36.01 TRINITY_DN6395_c0_g3_i2:103-987(-)
MASPLGTSPTPPLRVLHRSLAQHRRKSRQGRKAQELIDEGVPASLKVSTWRGAQRHSLRSGASRWSLLLLAFVLVFVLPFTWRHFEPSFEGLFGGSQGFVASGRPTSGRTPLARPLRGGLQVVRQTALRAEKVRCREDSADKSEGCFVGSTSEDDTMIVKVFTPEGVVLEAEAAEVSLPGVEGRLGILRGHSALVAPVAYGLLRYKQEGRWVPIVVHGGYATVERDIVTVLCSLAEIGDGIPSAEESRKLLEESSAKLANSESRRHRLDAADNVKLASARLQAHTLIAKEGKRQ